MSYSVGLLVIAILATEDIVAWFAWSNWSCFFTGLVGFFAILNRVISLLFFIYSN
jgi:hypothetical protein